MPNQDRQRRQARQSPRRSPNKSPTNNQQLNHPLLHRNRTQSQASYEGNTIDMVRIVRKNQELRHSLVNIDRKQYVKYQQLYYKDSKPWRHSQTSNKQQYHNQNNTHKSQEQNISSTFVHMGTELQLGQGNKRIIQHYVRPSNVNLLSEMNQEGNNKVLGWTLFALFLILFSVQILVSAYFLNASHVIFQHYDYILVYSQDYYDYIFEEFERLNFLLVLILYLAIQCAYHLAIFLINQYTHGQYKLIDHQTSKLSYILRCRDFHRSSHSGMHRFIKSPKFTIALIMGSTIASAYGIVHCYYYNQLNQIYVYYMSSTIIKLIEIFYFAVILPQTWRFLFFEKIHISQQQKQQKQQKHQNHQLNDSYEYSQGEGWKIPPLTDFNTDNWWVKLGLIVLLGSIIYSLCVSWWLIVVSFAKIQMSFKKIKYRMDTFYLQALGKLVLLIICIIVLFLREQSSFDLSIKYCTQCMVFVTISLLLSRILCNIFIRQQLYKYLFSQIHINIINIFFVFLIVYLLDNWTREIQFMCWRLILVGTFCMGLIISVYTQGNHREIISFEAKDARQSQAYVQMGNF